VVIESGAGKRTRKSGRIWDDFRIIFYMFSMKNLGRASKFGESETGLKRTKVEKAKKGAQKEWKNVVWKASKKEAQKTAQKGGPLPNR
jgi:hypothetical protein